MVLGAGMGSFWDVCFGGDSSFTGVVRGSLNFRGHSYYRCQPRLNEIKGLVSFTGQHYAPNGHSEMLVTMLIE